MNFITCISKINKGLEDDKSVSHLLIGTESSNLIVMEPSGVKEKKRYQFASVPVFIQVYGQQDVDHKIFVACRDGKVYVVKNGAIQTMTYDIESKPVGLIYMAKAIIVGGMNSKIHSFYSKGKKNFSIYLPKPIMVMEKMDMGRSKSMHGLLVALTNGEI
jgi:Bardet-Biedl syndrome 1 protein